MGTVTGRRSRRGWGPGRGARGALLALICAALVTPAVVGPAVAASGPTFGTPTVTATFLSGITVTEPVTLPVGVARVDALVQIEGSTRTFVTPVGLPGSGQPVLSYRFATPSGSLMPNTVVQLGFRVTLADGTMVPGPTARIRYQDDRFAWQTLSGGIVRVHWLSGGNAFGQRALGIAEAAIAKASDLLGVTETDPIDFYVYPDARSFYDVLGPGARENVGGVAFPEIRTLFANIGSTQLDDPWVGTVIPHELTHLVFGTATANPYHEPTHWLNEGLAVYLSQGYDAGSRSAVAAAVGDGSLMPITALDGQFPTAGNRFALAYDEAVSAVDFMVRTYGRPALVKLIKSYADGLTDDEAFQAGIGLDEAGFEAAWLADLGAPAPSPYGPRPAPAGPLPSGWSGTAATPGAAAASVPPGSSPGGGGSPDGLVLAVGLVVLFALGFIVATGLSRRRRATSSEPPDGGGWT